MSDIRPAWSYGETAEELCRRIFRLIPANPQIMELSEPFGLFKVPGFECNDLQPSLAQASAALAKAKAMYLLGEQLDAKS
jgi:hypothetical protein